MQKIPKEQLRKRFQILADTLQDVIFSENTAASIRKAAVLGDIEEKSGLLAEMVGLLLMGFLNPAEFSAELQRELGVTADTARRIESSLNAEVFSLVQTELRKLYPPTIKTPTVISPSFAPKGAKEGASGFVPQVPKPPLSGSIVKLEVLQPEKYSPSSAPEGSMAGKPEAKAGEFEKRFFQPAIPTTGAPKKTVSTPEDFLKARAPIIAPLAKEPPKIQIPTIQPEKDSEIKTAVIKPVVPLPTYIQSQFQKREPAESRYREEVEVKTPLNQPKPKPKISGNVIDLRNRS